jgi:hypothetical protein
MKCKNCKQPFEPVRFLQKYCFKEECVKVWVQSEKAKQWKKSKAKLKLDLMTKSDYEKILQQLVNKYVRLRDKGQPCISCQKPIKGKTDAGHLYAVGNYPSIRYDLRNINAQCITCNQFNGGMINEYRINFVKKYSEKDLEELDQLAHKTRKYSIPELQEMITEFKEKIKEYERN